MHTSRPVLNTYTDWLLPGPPGAGCGHWSLPSGGHGHQPGVCSLPSCPIVTEFRMLHLHSRVVSARDFDVLLLSKVRNILTCARKHAIKADALRQQIYWISQDKSTAVPFSWFTPWYASKCTLVLPSCTLKHLGRYIFLSTGHSKLFSTGKQSFQPSRPPIYSSSKD